jgi:hypothetical protein
MSKQQRFLILMGLLALSLLAGWPPAARANVTLVSFTAVSVPPAPEIYVQWETATQLATVGFFVTRSDSATGEYARVSDYIEREGDDLTGWKYDPWIDEDVVLGSTYWYKLEELTTNQSSLFYGPISAVAGALPTATSTPTPTRTPTRTPTATPTDAPAEPATNPTASTGTTAIATPRAVSAATVTPRPDTTGGSAAPATTAPAANAPAEVQTQGQPQAQPPSEVNGVPSVPPDSAVSSAPLPAAEAPSVAEVAQAPDPTLVPPDAVPAVSAPAVVVTETAPAATTAETSSNTPVLLLVGAAFVFLGIAFFILRQVRA